MFLTITKDEWPESFVFPCMSTHKSLHLSVHAAMPIHLNVLSSY
jgi:hypothetical protein